MGLPSRFLILAFSAVNSKLSEDVCITSSFQHKHIHSSMWKRNIYFYLDSCFLSLIILLSPVVSVRAARWLHCALKGSVCFSDPQCLTCAKPLKINSFPYLVSRQVELLQTECHSVFQYLPRDLFKIYEKTSTKNTLRFSTRLKAYVYLLDIHREKKNTTKKTNHQNKQKPKINKQRNFPKLNRKCRSFQQASACWNAWCFISCLMSYF